MNNSDIFNAVKVAFNAIDDKLGSDIIVLDTSNISPLADYFIIASANNSSQLKAISESVEEQLHLKCNLQKKHSEGIQSKSWILLDFNYIIVHLFISDERDFYNLESIWSDATPIEHSLLIS